MLGVVLPCSTSLVGPEGSKSLILGLVIVAPGADIDCPGVLCEDAEPEVPVLGMAG